MWRYNINHLKHWTDAIVDGKSSGVGDEPDWEKCIDVVHVPPKNARSSGASSVNSEASSSSTPNSTVNQSLVNNNSPNLLELFILQSQQRMEIEAKRADVFQSTLLAMMSSSFKPQVIFFSIQYICCIICIIRTSFYLLGAHWKSIYKTKRKYRFDFIFSHTE